MTTIPEWVRSQRRANGECEQCGQEPAATTWAGNGWLIGWNCVAKRQAEYDARCQS
jgi:hypothetical protein